MPLKRLIHGRNYMIEKELKKDCGIMVLKRHLNLSIGTAAKISTSLPLIKAKKI